MQSRREFLFSSAALLAAPAGKPRFGLVRSTHAKLRRPVSPEDPLDYALVRDMVWRAIEYGKPAAGSLEAKVKPGSWVVIKPNIVSLPTQSTHCYGDVTDMRVTKAVLEYVARNSRARRITVAEGGSYRRVRDPIGATAVLQNGVRVDASTLDWGTEQFPGWDGTIEGMLREFGAAFPGKQFDYIDLSYDGVRDAAGNLRRIEVPRTAGGVGAFGARPDYFVTRTILNCDFLISVPVMKVHEMCGITACLKNYVGTAPREAYASPRGGFSNTLLHSQHQVEDRIDPFIADLAAFHPPDYVVADGIRGLQYTEHNNRRPDQMVRNNLVLAGEDPVAADALTAYLLGFSPGDIEFLHMAAQRGMGGNELGRIEVVGEEADRLRRAWIKPRTWHGRGNRHWLVTRAPESPLAGWARYGTPTDTLHFTRWAPDAAEGQAFAAAVKVISDGNSKGFLWTGARGRVTVLLNGEKVLEEENRTRYRPGQFQKPVTLRSGENLLVFHLQAVTDQPQLSAFLVNARNDGDTLDGIRWTA
ncbi:MAG: DUF362 domain-containing protein [Acidobacteria bacterium]|nr:DUF362 domain-containing protein [Acidobacteriota bacterium]